MVLALIATASVVYNWSYNIVWYKLGSLFEIISLPSKKGHLNSVTGWETNDNTFFYKFYTDYSVSSHKLLHYIRIMFATAMVCYCLTVEIILWQIFTADMEQKADFITTFIWPLISTLLTILLILVQPFLIVISMLDKFLNDKLDMSKLTMFSAGIVAFLIVFLKLLSFGPFSYTENILTKLSIAGVALLAALSGIATVSTIYYTALLLWDRHRFKGAEVHNINNNSNKSLLWATDRMVKEHIHDYESNIEQNIQILAQLEAQPGGKNSPLRDQLIEKIGWYQLEVGKLENQIREPTHIRTIKKLFHLVFLVYCTHKLITTFTMRLPHIIMHAIEYPDDYTYDHFNEPGTLNVSSDPLAVTLANILNFFLFRFDYQQDLDALIKQISLMLSTSLFICTLSTVVTTISYLLALMPIKFQILAMFAMQSNEDSKALPVTQKNTISGKKYRSPPSMIKNLIVSQLTGTYVVATMLTIRSNVPFQVSTKLNELLGERFSIPTVVIDSWFYEVFAVSCIITIVGILIAENTLLLHKA